MSEASGMLGMRGEDKKRSEAAAVYSKYPAPFLRDVKGAKTKELLARDEDVQVLHGFETTGNAIRFSPCAIQKVVHVRCVLGGTAGRRGNRRGGLNLFYPLAGLQMSPTSRSRLVSRRVAFRASLDRARAVARC
jgi:hypothetical protein